MTTHFFRPIQSVFLSIILLLAGWPMLAAQTVAAASNITVNTLNDELVTNGNCSLREALRAVRQSSQQDGCGSGALSAPFVITLPAGTISLSLIGSGDDAGDLDVLTSATVTINGMGITQTNIVQNAASQRVMEVTGTAKLNLNNLTLSSGAGEGAGLINHGQTALNQVQVSGNAAGASNGGGLVNTAGAVMTVTLSTIRANSTNATGGGIFNAGSMLIDRSSVSDNAANTGSGDSGGIRNEGSMRIVASTIARNNAQSAGGIRNGVVNTAVMIIINSTISSNSANGGGGGVANNGELKLFSVTIAENTADAENSSGGQGGGISTGGAGSNTEMRNTIIAANHDPGSTDGATPDCSGPLVSLGNNLIGTNTSCETALGSDLFGTPATPLESGVQPLFDFGGPTETHDLQLSSPALNVGASPNCVDETGAPLSTDQRGLPRKVSGTCDIGAVERGFGNFETLFVNTTADTYTPEGNCSIREAIRAANLRVRIDRCPAGGTGNNVILLPPNGNIELDRDDERGDNDSDNNSLMGDLDITRTVTIKPREPGTRTSIAGFDNTVRNWRERIFDVDGSAGLTLERIDITRGRLRDDGDGGCIYAAAQLTLIDVTVTNCEIKRGDGAGIYASDLDMLRGDVSSNRLDSREGLGIGIAIVKSAEITGTNIHDNDYNAAIVAFDQELPLGGGIAIVSSLINAFTPTVRLNAATVRANRAFNGAGIYIPEFGALEVVSSTISGNIASGKQNLVPNIADNASRGGGVFVNCSRQVLIIDSTFTGNTALDSSGQGGAMFFESGCAVTATIRSSEFNSNQAQFGGALFINAGAQNFQPTIIITSSLFVANSANYGGALGVGHFAGLSDSLLRGQKAKFDVQNSTFTSNTASLKGGAVAALRNSRTTLNFCTFVGNNSTLEGGVLHAQSFHAVGGGGDETGADMSLRGSLFARNSEADRGNVDAVTDFGGTGDNMIEDPTNLFDLPFSGHDTFPANVLLAALANNGGRLRTHALLAGSPAIDRVFIVLILEDQRGQPRNVDGRGNGVDVPGESDYGAYEAPAGPLVTATATPTATRTPTPTGTLAASATATSTGTATPAVTPTPTSTAAANHRVTLPLVTR